MVAHFHYIPKSALSAGGVSSSSLVLGGLSWPSGWGLTPSWSKHRTRARNSRSSLSSLGSKRATNPSASPANRRTPATSKPATSNRVNLTNLIEELQKAPLSSRHVESDGSVFDQARLPSGPIKGLSTLMGIISTLSHTAPYRL